MGGGVRVGAGVGVDCGATDPELVACEDGDREYNGFVWCTNDVAHRPRVEMCEGPKSEAQCFPEDTNACTAHADCAAESRGFCGNGGFGGGCYCSYGCAQDSDCGDGQVCHCQGAYGQCTRAFCTSDADCPGSICASFLFNDCGSVGFACVTSADECLGEGDCGAGETCYFANGKRSCEPTGCVPGRPFLIDRVARTASVRSGLGWGERVRSQDLADAASRMPPATREQVAQHYLAGGLMEHASVAAFARFMLQLMSLGAPRELLLGAAAAQADELNHAELCFGVARLFGAELEPGPIDVAGALSSLAPEEVLTTTLLEGCVGEAVAAAIAEEAALLCTDQYLAEALHQLGRDELRHAQLAWQSVNWLLASYPELRPRAAEVLALACQEEGVSSAQAHDASLEAYGVLSRARSSAIRRGVLRHVIAPMLNSLQSPPRPLAAPQQA